MLPARSLAQPTHGLHPADDIAAGVGLVGFADVSQCLRVAEDVDGLLHLSEILWTDKHSRGVAVAGQHDPLMLTFHPVNELR